MASEPAWACVASSAFPLVYAYGKDMSLGGRQSRVLEKDHAKLLQALEQQLKLKGTTHANKAETLLFYSHAPFLTQQQLELVLARLAEQFQAINELGFRLAILEMVRRIEGQFKHTDVSDTTKIVGPIYQVLQTTDDVQTRIVALQLLALLATLVRDDVSLHQAIVARCVASTSDEADAAHDTARALLAHSPVFQRTLLTRLLTESTPTNEFVALAPLLPLATTNAAEAALALAKCEALCNDATVRGPTGDLSYIHSPSLRPLVLTMAALSLQLLPDASDRMLCVIQTLFTASSASLRRIAVAGIAKMLTAGRPVPKSVVSMLLDAAADASMDAALLLSIVSQLEVAARSIDVPLASLRWLSAEPDPKLTSLFLHMTYHASRRSVPGALLELLRVLAVTTTYPVSPATTTIVRKALRLLEALVREMPDATVPTLGPVLLRLLAGSSPHADALWVAMSHLTWYMAVPTEAAASALASSSSTRQSLAILVCLLRSGGDASALVLRAHAAHRSAYMSWQLARECILHGAFATAAQLLPSVVAGTLSSTTHHWTSAVALWVDGEALVCATTSAVPLRTFDLLHEALATLQLATCSDTSFETLSGFVSARLGLLSTLQSALQYAFESIIASGQVFSTTKWTDLQHQLQRHARTFAVLSHAAWSTTDLDALASHVSLCEFVAVAIDKTIHGRTATVATPTVLPRHPSWQFVADYAAHLARTEDAPCMESLVSMLQAVCSLPAAVPRPLLRSDAPALSLDMALAPGPSVKQISRTVLGVTTAVDLAATIHVSLQLDAAVSPASPLRDTSCGWTLQLEVTLSSDGVTTVFDAPLVAHGDGSCSSHVPLVIEASRLGEHSSHAISIAAWVATPTRRCLLAAKALDRTVVVY
ncbi:hypothetical protein SDRG_00681 [Saprolegnia diclina VS20]|uniref:Integrator complex subunit 7 n=1 Tax=Saprolegnia diclina (strain VS20) TaxID=1156394 RepID=T0SFN7_SAPDV|nr:hypothetical protein SDRG_00681 [Saprolegnia diclina VS20]EQC41822.1 hypothetical protein SDRG_00681 [Saprolegnia diclina VS20]|eukprot:XP_008604391.1 hypothetical protein SDRG_00681 [Saprolegnia diclina VS20]